ncbi:MAG: DUF1549 and DUF1553 domain-containing protein [Planctomycetes bacterium]|nr:DUF1549 and DUF1553 domain-containing protein [Planctomycetota bacterium]
MKRTFLVCLGLSLAVLGSSASANDLDRVLAEENRAGGVTVAPAPVVDDLAFLRRVYIDLIGRIPTTPEIDEYMAWPAAERRSRVVDGLLEHERFNDRWTVFFADMLRLRSNAEGGAALLAFVYQSLNDRMPYDELARRLISAGGKAGSVPEVGYVLGDAADPMALAGVTSQVFMGVRIACAQCHDHPFDVWTRKDFYGLAAYFGKTRRQQRQIGDRILGVYTTEVEQTSVLWPPEGIADDADRKPMPPTFPIALVEGDRPSRYIARLAALRSGQDNAVAVAKADQPEGDPLDDLLADAAEKAQSRTKGGPGDALGVLADVKRDVAKIDVQKAAWRPSDLRTELAELITDPRNRYFSRSFANRVWTELVGRGFVEPVDDFSDKNPPTRPETLDFLADEFVAGGYDLRKLVRLIVTSDAYQRGHAADKPEAERLELEQAFLATPMRRMLSEALYDSIVTAGHLFDVKHVAGKNLKTVWRETRVPKRPDGSARPVEPMSLAAAAGGEMKAMPAGSKKPATGYDLEKAIELDFDKLLAKRDEPIEVETMMVKSAEEIEAERMAAQARERNMAFIDRFVKDVIDDNPLFTTAMRMQSPAPFGHFLRVFGQPNREDLGGERDHSPTMRQALMILNGRITHEASRVGELEPLYALVAGKQANLDAAVGLAYCEILTRDPSDEELADARAIIAEAQDPLAGIADLRWVLLNSNEFRFLP